MARKLAIPEYYEGDVFTSGQKMRRIIGFAKDRKGLRCVVYSTGGNKNRKCRLRAFHLFAAAGKLEYASSRRPVNEA